MSMKDLLKNASIPAALAGIGLAAMAPVIIRGIGGGSRPLAKSLLHKYLDLADRAKEFGAETQEEWKDLLAEVQAERRAREEDEMAAAGEHSVQS